MAAGNYSHESQNPLPGQAAMVYSDIPAEVSEKDIVWYRGIRADLDRAVLTRGQAVSLKGLEPGEDVAYTVLSLGKCLGRCSLRGHCVQQVGSGPKCACWQGYDGFSCELVSGVGRGQERWVSGVRRVGLLGGKGGWGAGQERWVDGRQGGWEAGRVGLKRMGGDGW